MTSINNLNQELKFTKDLFSIFHWILICPTGHYFYNRNANGLRMATTMDYSAWKAAQKSL
jgi:hypothetical protein